jgi:hypothetical protein
MPSLYQTYSIKDKIFKYEKGKHSSNKLAVQYRGIYAPHKGQATRLLKAGCTPAQVTEGYPIKGPEAVNLPTVVQIKNYKRSVRGKRKQFSNNDIQQFFEAHHCGSKADYDSYEEEKLIALNSFAQRHKNNDGNLVDKMLI